MGKLVETYSEFLDLKQYAESTKRVYLRMKKLLKDKPSQRDVNRFLLNHPYKSARGFLKSYVWDFLHLQKEIDIRKIKGRQRRGILIDKVLSDSEYEIMLKALPARECLMVRILKETAMRQHELLTIGARRVVLTPDFMTWHNDYGACRLDFGERKVVWWGKGRKKCIGLFTSETKRLLEAYISTRRYRGFGTLFRIKRARFYQVITGVSLKVLGKRVSSHWYKRTAGRYWEDLGFTLEERQFALHHSNPKTTQDHYSYKKGRDVLDKIRVIHE